MHLEKYAHKKKIIKREKEDYDRDPDSKHEDIFTRMGYTRNQGESNKEKPFVRRAKSDIPADPAEARNRLKQKLSQRRRVNKLTLKEHYDLAQRDAAFEKDEENIKMRIEALPFFAIIWDTLSSWCTDNTKSLLSEKIDGYRTIDSDDIIRNVAVNAIVTKCMEQIEALSLNHTLDLDSIDLRMKMQKLVGTFTFRKETNFFSSRHWMACSFVLVTILADKDVSFHQKISTMTVVTSVLQHCGLREDEWLILLEIFRK